MLTDQIREEIAEEEQGYEEQKGLLG